jgi:iron complex outermembrane receptor protein
VGSPNHPATPPSEGGLNPNWEAYQDYADQTLLFRHRFAANGPRDTDIDSQVYDVDLSVQGRIGMADVEAGLRRTESQYFEFGRNYIVSALAQPQFDAGSYNIYDPFGTPQDVLQSFTATITRDANYVANEYYANANMDLFELPAGPIGFAFGAEYRDETYADLYDDLQANGNITGSAGNSSSGGRDSRAAFVEALFPLLDNLEMSAALRYDDYSDFGSATSPKVAFRFQPLDELTLRASWGQGFRAPPLDILSARPSFSADFVADIPTCLNQGLDENCNVPGTDQPGVTQITAFAIANPGLDAEDSEQFSVGAAWEPFEWLNGSVDYWSTEIEGRVAAITAQQIIDCLDGTTLNCPPGLSMFDPNASIPNPDLGLGLARSPTTGAILFLQRGFASLGTIETSGIDFNVVTNFDFGNSGRLTSELQATYTDEFVVDSGDDVAGTAGLPELRALLSNQWRIGDFTFAWNINHIGSQSDSFTDENVGLPSWTTHDLQANWYTPWDGRLTVGIDNVGDKDPVLDPADPTGRGFNFNLYDGYGRIPYVRYTQTF